MTSSDRLTHHDSALEVLFTFTRAALAGWTGYQRRIDQTM